MAKKAKTTRKAKRNWTFIVLGSMVLLLSLFIVFQNRFYLYELAKHYYYKVYPSPKQKFDKSGEISGLGIPLPDGYSTYGIDVSRHQGIIDWMAINNQYFGKRSFSFAFIKATEGGLWKDGMYKYNWEHANETSLLCGAYHFYRPNIDPQKQINNFTTQVQLKEGNLPPVLDVEHLNLKLSISEQRDNILAILEGFENFYNVTPIIYTNKQIYTTLFDFVNFRKYPIWIAHYQGSIPNTNIRWKFWQLSEKGIVDGVDEFVDINVFNGSIYELRKLQIE